MSPGRRSSSPPSQAPRSTHDDSIEAARARTARSLSGDTARREDQERFDGDSGQAITARRGPMAPAPQSSDSSNAAAPSSLNPVAAATPLRTVDAHARPEPITLSSPAEVPQVDFSADADFLDQALRTLDPPSPPGGSAEVPVILDESDTESSATKHIMDREEAGPATLMYRCLWSVRLADVVRWAGDRLSLMRPPPDRETPRTAPLSSYLLDQAGRSVFLTASLEAAPVPPTVRPPRTPWRTVTLDHDPQSLANRMAEIRHWRQCFQHQGRPWDTDKRKAYIALLDSGAPAAARLMYLHSASDRSYHVGPAGARGAAITPIHPATIDDPRTHYPGNSHCVVVLCRETSPLDIPDPPRDVALPPDLPPPRSARPASVPASAVPTSSSASVPASAVPPVARLSHKTVGKMAITTKMGALAVPLFHMDTNRCEVIVWWVEMPPLDPYFHSMVIMHYDIYRGTLDDELEVDLRWTIERFRPHFVVSPTFCEFGQIYIPGSVFGLSCTRASPKLMTPPDSVVDHLPPGVQLHRLFDHGRTGASRAPRARAPPPVETLARNRDVIVRRDARINTYLGVETDMVLSAVDRPPAEAVVYTIVRRNQRRGDALTSVHVGDGSWIPGMRDGWYCTGRRGDGRYFQYRDGRGFQHLAVPPGTYLRTADISPLDGPFYGLYLQPHYHASLQIDDYYDPRLMRGGPARRPSPYGRRGH